ncbi:unnamed protein product [Heterobilharzia americana]|nr:unnamed protein product [Heterobilharzia americana]
MIMKLMMWFINEIVLCMLGFVDDLLSYKVTIGQKWGLYAEPHKSVDTETISFYENARHIIINNEDNIPREDFLIHQNPIYHGIDENANMNNNFQDLSSDEHFQSLNTLNQRSYSSRLEDRQEQQQQQHIPDDKVITPMRNNTLIENQSIIDSVSKLTITESIELREEPIDEIYGRFDHQDPYDAQLKALTAIETCRKEQSAQIQSILDSQSETVNIYNHSNMDEVLNETESLITGTTISNSIHLGSGILGKGGKLIPGSLLACVHRSVQQRCHSGAGTSSFTGRYACEAICEIVRERMPQLANRLEDCKQPLISCTERFIAFNVMIGKHLKQSTAIHKQTIYNTQTSTNGMLYETQFTGEYCNECGGRRWWIKQIPKTNLFFIINIAPPGSQTVLCKCNCQKRFRYGARIATDQSKPRPVTYRKHPPIPNKCRMVEDSKENSTVCTDGGKTVKWQSKLILLQLFIYNIYTRIFVYENGVLSD